MCQNITLYKEVPVMTEESDFAEFDQRKSEQWMNHLDREMQVKGEAGQRLPVRKTN